LACAGTVQRYGDKARIAESSYSLERAHDDEQRMIPPLRLEYAAPGLIWERRSNGLKWRKRGG